jgi:hypothetical protein
MENLVIETYIEGKINLDDKFLTSELLNCTSHPTYKMTNDYIESLPKEDRTIYMSLYLRKYKLEMDRLENNEAHRLLKLKKQAEKRGMTLEEYLSRDIKPRTVEYQFTQEEYKICKEQLELAYKSGNTEQKVYWMEVKEEKLRFTRNESSKKSKAKNKK